MREQLGSFKELVAEAASQVGRPTFFSMLIIIIAHIPIFTLQRHEGRIFAPMAYTITSALIGSLLFSLTLVPVLCVYCCAAADRRRRTSSFGSRTGRTAPVLKPALARPETVLLGAAAWRWSRRLLLVPQLGSEFLPELNEGSIWINFTLPAGHRSRRGQPNAARRARQRCLRYPRSRAWYRRPDVPTTAPIPSRST